jgi:hypothetical protein
MIVPLIGDRRSRWKVRTTRIFEVCGNGEKRELAADTGGAPEGIGQSAFGGTQDIAFSADLK